MNSFSPDSLLPIISTFLQHWEAVEEATPELGQLIVYYNTTRAGLDALREGIVAAPEAVAQTAGLIKLAREQEIDARRALLRMMKRFNMQVRADFADTLWERMLKLVPLADASFGNFLKPVRATHCLWVLLERETPGLRLTILGDGGRAGIEVYAAALQALEDAHDAVIDAGVDAALARAEQDILAERALAVMKAYGHGVKARLGDEHRLAGSLPQLWPGPRRGARKKKKRQVAAGNTGNQPETTGPAVG
jgi:hypothetical protein